MTTTLSRKEITTAYKMTMDELNFIIGGEDYSGVNEEDNAILEALIVAGLTAAAKIICSVLLPDTFEEFYKAVKDHPVIVESAITGIAGVPGLIAYNIMSESTQKKLWKKVYETLK